MQEGLQHLVPSALSQLAPPLSLPLPLPGLAGVGGLPIGSGAAALQSLLLLHSFGYPMPMQMQMQMSAGVLPPLGVGLPPAAAQCTPSPVTSSCATSASQLPPHMPAALASPAAALSLARYLAAASALKQQDENAAAAASAIALGRHSPPPNALSPLPLHCGAEPVAAGAQEPL